MLIFIDPFGQVSDFLFVSLDVCLFCLYPINVKTAEPMRPNFFVGPHLTTERGYGRLNFKKFASNKIRFLKILKINEIFFKNQRNVCFTMYTRRQCLQLKKKRGAKRPASLVF